jgi:hypothetical protein
MQLLVQRGNHVTTESYKRSDSFAIFLQFQINGASSFKNFLDRNFGATKVIVRIVPSTVLIERIDYNDIVVA